MCATIFWDAHESFMHPIFILKNGCDTLAGLFQRLTIIALAIHSDELTGHCKSIA
jgi:hypothetical protein